MTGQAATSGAPRRPWRSIRARIAIACAALFLTVGGILIGATYGIVGHISEQNVGKIALTGKADLKLYTACHGAHANGSIAQDPAFAKKCRQALKTGFKAGAARQQGSDQREFLAYSLAGLGVTTLLAGGLGWVVGGRVLRPLRAITEAARSASQENLDQRLALPGPPDELKELADTFDEMLARLDAAFASQRRFVANASHELRTPLTEMRTLIDVAMAKPVRTPGQLEYAIASVSTAVDRSADLIEALLTLARSDRGLSATETVDLPTAVEDAVDLVRATAADRKISIETELGAARTVGDRVLLDRLVLNLIGNAVQHNASGGWILVRTGSVAVDAFLEVSNSGAPIPADRLPDLTEPFQRLSHRVAGSAGSGLGLSIVQSVVTAHRGELELAALPAGGLIVRVRLHLADEVRTPLAVS